jgi:hypothetical protein
MDAPSYPGGGDVHLLSATIGTGRFCQLSAGRVRQLSERGATVGLTHHERLETVAAKACILLVALVACAHAHR